MFQNSFKLFSVSIDIILWDSINQQFLTKVLITISWKN